LRVTILTTQTGILRAQPGNLFTLANDGFLKKKGGLLDLHSAHRGRDIW